MSAESSSYPAPRIELDPLEAARLVGVPQGIIDTYGAPNTMAEILVAAACACSDEIKTDVYHDPDAQQFFGVDEKSGESVASRNIKSLIDTADPQAGRLILAAARSYAEQAAANNPGHGLTYVLRPNVIDAAVQTIPLNPSPQKVVEFGPGVRGIDMINNSIKQNFAYAAISEGPFVNEVLKQFLHLRLGSDMALYREWVEAGRFIGLENGMAAGSAQLLEEHAESVDVVICSFVHATEEEFEAGIAAAYELLKEDGTLFVQGPSDIRNVRAARVPIGQVFDMALRSGFERSKAIFLRQITLRNNLGKVSIKGAGFRK